MNRVVCIILLSILSLSAAAGGEIRTWTSADGRKLEAKLVSADKQGNIEIERADGQRFKLNAGQLSLEDQSYVKEFLEEMGSFPAAARGEGRRPLDHALTGRCIPSVRSALMTKVGLDPKIHEEAVVKTLDFLKSSQNPDGSWGVDYPVAMTGLALLAFTGHCEGTLSDAYGATVAKAATYVISSAQAEGMKSEDGKLSYENGIATYALAELLLLDQSASKTGQIPMLEKTVKFGIKAITEGQGRDGGWVYGYGTGGNGDSCVGAWQLQALISAHKAGMESETSREIEKAIQFFKDTQAPDGSTSYRREPLKPKSTLAGISPYLFTLWGMGEDLTVVKAMDYLDTMLESGNPSSYSWYFNSLAYAVTGGDDAKKWMEYGIPKVIAAQDPDGSFPRIAGGHGPKEPSTKLHYATTLAVLILEAPYRYVPPK